MTPTAAALEQAVRTFAGRLLDTLRGVPDDVLNTWKPAAATEGSHEMNTFAALAVHTVTAAEFHALHKVGRRPMKREREAEFSATTTFDEVERRSPAAADLLRLCAFLAPDGIPLETLVTHAETLPEPLASTLRDPDGARDAVSLLLRLSLADAGEARTINVHRLVQLVTREWLSDNERRRWADLARAAGRDVTCPVSPHDESLPVTEYVCGQEGAWLTQSVLLAEEHDMADIVEAMAKIQRAAARE